MWKVLAVLTVAAGTFVITPSEAHRKCPPNEEYVHCPPNSEDESTDCKPGCRCVDGYTRNEDGVCVPENDCPQSCPKNETLDPCYSPCPRRECGVNIAAVSCAPVSDCKPGCRCCDGYLRNAEGCCILEEDCPKCNEPNEVYDVCPAPCPPRRCDVDERVIRCAEPPKLGDPECKAGCRCADGYVRNPAGKCVTRDQCPPKCGEHEIFDDCPSKVCRPLECSEVGFPSLCPKKTESKCHPACICEEGYVKSSSGKCIPIKDCPSCGGDPHAESGCGVNCGRLCSNYNKEHVACIDICYPNACDCKHGFVYDQNIRKCVHPKDCTPVCERNEVYSHCLQGECRPKYCSELGYPIPCPKIDPAHCKKGCLCKPDFVRAANGTCIPKEKCPSCGGDPNAVSGCGVNCGRHCSDHKKGPVACPLICNLNGCDCKEGFVQDDRTGKCIHPKDCAPVCEKNEVYSHCIQGECRPKNCSELGYPIPCPKVHPAHCKKGCLCKENYVRDANGTCIPKEKCPSCGGDPNAVSGCGVNCGRHCSDHKKGPVPCPAICNLNGCDCKEGFVQDDRTGKCIHPKDCAPICEKNEVYSHCIQGECRPKNCSELGYPIPCPKVHPAHCKKGCLCKENYVRDANGTCIPKEKCPSCGGDPNAVSGCGVNCGRHCSDHKKGPVACSAICNLNGCDCKEGFVQDDRTGKCIHPKDCAPKCGKHEIFHDCPSKVCRPLECSQVGFPLSCSEKTGSKCHPACICEYGYVKSSSGKCIPIKDCPSCGGDPHAESGCGVNCGRLCSNYNKEPVSCIDICYENACDCRHGFVYDQNTRKCVHPEDCTPVCGKNEVFSDCVNGGCSPKNCSQLGEPVHCVKPKKCEAGCLCKDGFLRDYNGICIPKDKCPPKCLKPNEIYDPCPPICPPQTCESIGKVYSCPAIPADKPSSHCKGACRCKKGYYRNKIGECISEKDCLKCTGPHEYFSCGGACDNVCATLKEQNQTNCPIVNIKCNPMCYCEAGYARDDNNICIPIDQCPECQCGENERWEKCPDRLCTPQSCNELGFPIKCPDIPENKPCPGPPKCICEFNYVRNKHGKCIPKDQCPSCGGDPNAKSGCGINCGRLCSNYDKGPVPCPKICLPNSCDCKEGYVFDENIKKCVHPKDCTPVCGKNEVFSDCVNGGCSPKHCSQLGEPVDCVKPKKCKAGCLCKDGYLRDDNGICVPKDKCPLKCLKPNEIYDPCPPICPPQTCESIGKKYFCPFIPAHKRSEYCKGACRCKKGYYRNKIGECISEKDCLKCTGPNEYFSCGGACDNVCATLKEQNQTNCPIVNIKCNPMCYCEAGYARDANNICIPIDKCPECQCGENERWEKCPDRLCAPQSCNELGFPIKCPDIPENKPCPGPPKCICEFNYVRNKHGKCIPKDQCPSCGGDPNAKSGCGINCGRLCSNYDKGPVPCPRICLPNSCDCKEGYVFDENIKKCVRPKDCTHVCKINEVWDSCANGGCSKRNCSQLGQPDICIDVIKCIGGCVCQKGFLKAKNGTCIPQKQCPIPPCRKNERFEWCPHASCAPQSCSQLGFPVPCPKSPDHPDCSGPPACICDDDFVRNDNGDCIPKKHCPSCGGDPNAESGCGFNCGRLCSNYNKDVPCPKRLCKFNSCDCKKGYVFDVNTKKCVHPKECTPTCGENEVYSDCINGGCQPKNCSQIGKPIPCVKIDPKYCIKGCLCKEGYLRNANGLCVPKEHCKSKCTGPHEHFACGGACDNVCATLSQQNQTHCPIINIKCNPMCYCDEGYARDSNKICIPIAHCPVSCGGDPNAQPGCGVNCGRLCSNYKKKGVACPFICHVNGCDCKPGFVFDSNIGKCVRPKDCTPVCGTNEVWDTCANGGCRKWNCSQPIICIDPIKCKGGCVCREGFVRSQEGECIPEDDCPVKCTGPNEHFSCGSACDNVCATLAKQNQTHCPIINKKCNPKCYCNEGYARDEKNICIPIEQCDLQCGPNERYEENPSKVRDPQYCSDLGFEIVCPSADDPDCEDTPACLCDYGFVRNEHGQCIPKADCPSCGGDPNAEAGCGTNCFKHCSHYGKEVDCPLICYENACDCKKGFCFDEDTKKCVPLDDCSE